MTLLHTFYLRLLRQRSFASLPLACRMYRIDQAANTAAAIASSPSSSAAAAPSDALVLQRCGATPAQQRLDDDQLAALPDNAKRWLQPCSECAHVQVDAVLGELNPDNTAEAASPVSVFNVFEVEPRDAPLTLTLPKQRLRRAVERFETMLPRFQPRQRRQQQPGAVMQAEHSCEDDQASAAYYNTKPFVDACSQWICLPDLDERCIVQLLYY